LGGHQSLSISGLFGADLYALFGVLGFPALVAGFPPNKRRMLPSAEISRQKFKNASGINPRLKIEDLSVTLDLDPERIINRFLHA
jgi:hypothetical protein